MEIVLQWIDELDDLICALACISFRARFSCLQLGLLTALTIKFASAIADHLALMLGGVALACVVFWSAALLANVIVGDRSPHAAT